MNAEWHRANVMPKNATEQQRLEWHKEHQKYCGCRPIPENLQQLLQGRTGPPTESGEASGQD
jgi:hypothetical protein